MERAAHKSCRPQPKKQRGTRIVGYDARDADCVAVKLISLEYLFYEISFQNDIVVQEEPYIAVGKLHSPVACHRCSGYSRIKDVRQFPCFSAAADFLV